MFSKKHILLIAFILTNLSLFAARYSSSSCVQLNNGQSILPGTAGHQIIRVDLVGNGNNSGSSWNLASIAFSLTNSGNYSAAKLYYGTSTSFSSATLIQTITNPGSTATFSSYSTTPTASGSSNTTISLFLVVDLKSTISCNNASIDASVSASGLDIGGNGGSNNITPTSSNPTGSANVSSSVTPTISIAASASTICAGTSVTFTPTITNGGTSPTYQWRINSVNTATGSSFTSTTLANGDIVSCVLTSNHVCASTTTATSNNVTMAVTSTPSSNISPSGTVNVCTPTTSTTLTASSNLTSVAYQWQRDGVNLSGSTSSTLSTTISGAYSVVITKTGCSGTSATTNVAFGKTPAISATSSVTNFCSPTTLNLTTTNTTNFSSSFSNTNTAVIPDNSTTGATSNITVTGLPTTLTGVTVTATVNITHNNNTDLEVFLLRPNGSLITTGATPFYAGVAGQSIALSLNNGGTGNNYAATFSDAAATSVGSVTGNTTISGNYRPEQLFSTLSGNPNGVWSLRIFDDISNATGTFTGWTINFSYTDGTTYSWTSNPSGFTSSTKSPTGVSISNTTTYTVVATDQIAGCTASASVTATRDNVKPIPNCKNVTVSLNSSGIATITASQVNNGSTDNCSIASTTLSKSSFTCANIGANTVYLIVTDGSGNVDSCAATVTINDAIKPTVLTSSFTLALNSAGNATLTTANINNGSSDNCGISSFTLSKSNFSCVNLGTNTVYLIAQDASGNKDSAAATVTVIDNIKPTVVTSNFTLALNSAGAATLTTTNINNGSSDNCGISSLLLSKSSFSCTDIGSNTVYLIAQDASGNIDSAAAIVTVVDNIKPTVSCKNISVALNSAGTASITANDIDNGSNDNCSITSLSLSTSSFNHTNLGANSVYLIATDPSGNKDSCLATVTIIDNTNPVANCNSINVTLGSNGTVSITASQVDNGSTDNAFPPSLSLSNYNFDCTNIGLNYVYLIATDEAGNKDSCLATINVINNLSASAVVTTPILCNGGSAQVAVTAAGGSGNYTGTGTISLAAGTHTITVTDVTGCSAQTTITISEPSAINLSGISTDPICHNGSNGSINISVSGGTNPYAFLWSTLETTEDISSLQAGNYSVTVTDANGCSQNANFSLSNPASYSVVVNTTSNACFGDNNGTAAAVVTGGQTPYSYLWDNDNETTDSISNLFAGYYNVIVTDGNNCTVIAPFAITQPDPISVQILTNDNSTICYNSSINIEGYVDGTYQTISWTSNGDGAFSANNLLSSNYTPGSADIAAGQVTLTLSAVSISGCPATLASINVLIKNKPARPSDISGPAQICLGNQASYSVLSSPDANSYNWTTANASTVQSGQGTNQATIDFPITVVNSGTYIYVNAENECGISLSRQVWVRHNVGSAQFQVGPNTVCPGALNVYYRVRKVEGADSIKWTIPPGCTIASNTDTTAYINFDNTYTGGVIKVTAYFACANSIAQLKTSVPITRVPGNITGPIAGLCDTTVTYSIPPVTGASAYLWVPPAGASVVGANDGISCTIYFSPGFTPGIISVYALNECGTAGAARTLNVKAVPQTPSVINGPATICANQQNVTYSTPAIVGVNSYIWSVPSTATIVSGQGTTSIVVNFGNKNGGINVQANRVCSGNSSTKTLAYTITCREGNLETSNTVNIMPNPSHGNFSIAYTTNESSKTVISIIDLTGRVIYSEEKQSSEGVNEFPMQTNLAAGMYMLRIESGSDIQQKQFIIE